MSKLSAMIAQASVGLSVQQRISDEKWAAIAHQCGYEEIAEIVGITQNYVRVKMNRIKAKLKKLMGEV